MARDYQKKNIQIIGRKQKPKQAGLDNICWETETHGGQDSQTRPGVVPGHSLMSRTVSNQTEIQPALSTLALTAPLPPASCIIFSPLRLFASFKLISNLFFAMSLQNIFSNLQRF